MKILKIHKGFTLVETLVAIGILVVAITGAFTASQSGLSSYLNSKNQAIAVNLAQESIEMIRAYRDSNRMVAGTDWLENFASPGDPCYFGNTCQLSVLNSTENETCPGGLGTCDYLRQDPVTGYYNYDPSSTQTVFKREIQITPIYPVGCTTACTEVSVLVSVTWSKGASIKQYKTRENLFSW
jgi:prepilin-type N-terminal cleavage/methylation domain-containing protein